MDIQTIAICVGGIFLALILLKFIVKIPLLLIKYGILALIIFGIYMLLRGNF